ncbi:hypothetical protein FKP32DRAFT_1585149 [Trametes sanguinea]|nr:hypothetical protein FKP32DRAFT_1585149 [Trametes sanguinea]
MATLTGNLLAAAADVTDSSDFPGDADAPGLRALDDALRCDICRDFYDAPVSLVCGHTFCSVCIRSALPVNATCPTCRKAVSESTLRKNVAVETAVATWQKARSLILRLAKEEIDRKTRPQPSSRTRQHSGERSRKRKRSGSSVSISDEIVIPSSSPVPSGSVTPDALPDTVECPICQKAVLSKKINMHIDSGCKRHLAGGTVGEDSTAPKGKQKQRWSELFNSSSSSNTSSKSKEKSKGKARSVFTIDIWGEEESELSHIPKVAYDIHRQKRLVELLNEWGLPTNGDRNALIWRHSKWVVLYNANVDRAPENRRSLDQLRAELRKAEEAEHKTRKEVVDDPVAYQKANKDIFDKLTEAARPRKPANTGELQPAPESELLLSESTPPQANAETRTADVIDVDSN